jgi:hypothetical protein
MRFDINDGVFFDTQTGAFESLSVDDSTDEVVISHPETGEELERVSKDIFDSTLHIRVPDSVVEDPVQYYQSHLGEMVDNSLARDDFPIDKRVAFEYCRSRVEVTEVDD